MENAQPPGVDGGCRLEGVDTSPGRLAADEPHVFILNKMVETSDGVGSAAHAVAYARKLAPTMGKDQIIVITVSGRGDKDCAAIARYRGEDIHE